MKSIILVLSLLISNSVIISQTVSGKISGKETWRGTVTLTGDVVVTKTGRLTILPGTIIKILPKRDDQISGYDKNLIEIIVDGEFIADGTPGAQITFTSASADKKMGDWFGIVIQNRKSTTSIRNSIVEYGFDGITIISSRPNIFSNIIQYNFNSGITCKIKAKPKIYDNTIFANGWAGVFSLKKAKPILSGNRISMNDYGIIVMKSGEANLGNLKGQGVENNPGQNLIIGNNTFAMDNHSKYPIFAQNNTWAGPDNVPAQDVSELIFDAKDNPGSGEVIYLPVFGEGQLPIAASQQLDQQNMVGLEGATALAGADLGQPLPVASDQIAGTETQLLADSTDQIFASGQDEALQDQELTGDAVPLSAVIVGNSNLPGEKIEEEQPAEPEAESKINEIVVKKPPLRKGPAQEWQIDKRRRQYAEKRPQPEYPSVAYKTKTTGQVIVELIADEQGKVISSRILKTDSEVFNEVAIEAAQKIKYQPMTINGEPVQVKLIERYIFNIR